MSSYQYSKSHCGDKTILRPSYLHNGISYTGMMTISYVAHRDSQITKFMGSTWGPHGSCGLQVGPCWPHGPYYQDCNVGNILIGFPYNDLTMQLMPFSAYRYGETRKFCWDGRIWDFIVQNSDCTVKIHYDTLHFLHDIYNATDQSFTS